MHSKYDPTIFNQNLEKTEYPELSPGEFYFISQPKSERRLVIQCSDKKLISFKLFKWNKNDLSYQKVWGLRSLHDKHIKKNNK